MEYATLLDTNADICRRRETVQKPSKLENIFNKVSKEIKKLLNGIGDLKMKYILQKSYFSYDVSNLLKETYVSELDKKNINILLCFLFWKD